MSDKTVLIIDDDDKLLKMLSYLFRAKGFKVEISENGFDALERLEKMIPDVIILDLMMPVIDGFEFLNKIKKDTSLKEVPIIVLSALPSSKNKEKCLSMGAYDYIDKPFKSLELVNQTIEAIEATKKQ